MAKPPRTKNKDNARRSKKKVSLLTQEQVEYIDWKDVNLLRRFMSDRAKIRARRVTGNNAQQQRLIAQAIKNAREMALLPYATRVTQQRGGRRGDGDRGDRGDRGPRPPRDAGPGPEAEAEGTEVGAEAPEAVETVDAGATTEEA
jgi:small subunit ribosomal protein S18